MNYLLMDTSDSHLRVAVSFDGIVEVHEDAAKLQHSVTLFPAIERLVAGRKNLLGCIAVCVGPGSFTGIRIGVAAAKMLGYALGIPLMPFTSTEAVAYNSLKKDLTVVLDGGNRARYVQRFLNGKPIGECRCVESCEVAGLLSGSTAIGDCDNLESASKSVTGLCRMVEEKIAAAEFSDYSTLEPLYVQLPQAEKERLKGKTGTVRRMKLCDVSAVERLERECFPDPWSAQLLMAELENPRARLLVKTAGVDPKSEILGAISAWTVLDECELGNLAVTASARRKGIAKELLNALSEILRQEGIRRITLETRVSNAAAIALYESLGFQRVGIRPHYYKGGEDAIIFARNE